MVSIRFLKKEDGGKWFDLSSRQIVNGTEYAFEITDSLGSKWILNVRVQSSGEKADVYVATTERVTSLHDQLKRKSIVFNETSDGEKFYNVLGISFVDEGRLHSKRISNSNELPQEITTNFEIKKYQEIKESKSIPLQDKLVVVLDKNKTEDMIKLFYLEKIMPIEKFL